ncbi:hypothetical protein HAX54_033399 [Datura stramonium]|uniref:Uncharacterized protein n=1 Tax=Datura stramonium TaxID=4076 RepID=A0ABS8VF85_DATST|nr:hypothetical protein [Datura stramonium]
MAVVGSEVVEKNGVVVQKMGSFGSGKKMKGHGSRMSRIGQTGWSTFKILHTCDCVGLALTDRDLGTASLMQIRHRCSSFPKPSRPCLPVT